MSTYSAGEATRKKIITATGELAAELGLSNITTRAVAKRAGENIGSIHYHFGGKNKLFEAVVLDAISGCVEKEHYRMLDALAPEEATPEKLSAILRIIVKGEIDDLFRTDRPRWHAQLIYQLLQREDRLFEMFRAEVMEPGLASMKKFFRLIEPGIGDDEVLLRMTILKMPIFAHANYMPVFLRRLTATSYPEKYLKKMEDLLVRQTQLLLGLPESVEGAGV